MTNPHLYSSQEWERVELATWLQTNNVQHSEPLNPSRGDTWRDGAGRKFRFRYAKGGRFQIVGG